MLASETDAWRPRDYTIDIAEATRFALLGVVKTTSPVDGNIAFVAVQSRSTFHAASGANSTELKETVKHGAIVSYIVPALFLHEVVHIVRCDLGQEVDIFVGVELGHLVLGGRFRTLIY